MNTFKELYVHIMWIGINGQSINLDTARCMTMITLSCVTNVVAYTSTREIFIQDFEKISRKYWKYVFQYDAICVDL